MKIKKLLFLLLLLLIGLLLFMPNNVNANSYKFLEVDGKELYDDTGTFQTNISLNGAEYNEETNTLTLDGYNGGRINASDISDFTIEIKNDNTITYDPENESFAIYSLSRGLKIIGDGTLNIIETSPYNVQEWGAIRTLLCGMTIDGPTVNIIGAGNNALESSGSPIYIKNSKININTSGDYGIHSGNLIVSDSEISVSAKKYAVAGENISFDGNTTLKAKTTSTSNDTKTLYSSSNAITFTTEGTIVLEKSGGGELVSPEPQVEYEMLENTYTYNVEKDTNKVSYTLKEKSNNTLIDLIEIDGTPIKPVQGEQPNALNLLSEKYEVINYMWHDDKGNLFERFETGKGYELYIILSPKKGYYFNNSTKVIISEMDDTYIWSYDDDPTSYTYGVLHVISTKLMYEDYKFVSGANQMYTIGKSTEAVFEIDGNKEKVDEVCFDNLHLDNEDYRITGDDKKITIAVNKEFLDNLSEGKHTLEVIYGGIKSVKTEFTVTKQQPGDNIDQNEDTIINDGAENTETGIGSNTPPTGGSGAGNISADNTGSAPGEVSPENNAENTDSNKPTGSNPQTGDNIILFVAILLVAVVGIIITTKVRKTIKK